MFCQVAVSFYNHLWLDFVVTVHSSKEMLGLCHPQRGHKIKNQTCKQICSDPRTRRCPHRIQNNLKELWAVINWATSGRLLVHFQTLKMSFLYQSKKEGTRMPASIV